MPKSGTGCSKKAQGPYNMLLKALEGRRAQAENRWCRRRGNKALRLLVVCDFLGSFIFTCFLFLSQQCDAHTIVKVPFQAICWNTGCSITRLLGL